MKRCGVTEETRRSLLISSGLSERTSEVWRIKSYSETQGLSAIIKPLSDILADVYWKLSDKTCIRNYHHLMSHAFFQNRRFSITVSIFSVCKCASIFIVLIRYYRTNIFQPWKPYFFWYQKINGHHMMKSSWKVFYGKSAFSVQNWIWHVSLSFSDLGIKERKQVMKRKLDC